MSAPNLQGMPAQMAGSPGQGLPGRPMGILPAAQLQWGAQAAEFSTDLCDCCDNMSICFKTLFCPCLTFSEIHEHVTGEPVACEYCLLCLLPFTFGGCCWAKLNRSRLRKMYGLTSKGCCAGDCCVHCGCFCCHCCAMCQERREIEFRQHAMATTQAMVGNQMVRGTGGVIAQPNPYPPPPGTMTPASSGPAMFIADNGSGNLVTLPSGQVVLMTPVMQAPAPAQYAAPSPTSNGVPTTQFIAK